MSRKKIFLTIPLLFIYVYVDGCVYVKNLFHSHEHEHHHSGFGITRKQMQFVSRINKFVLIYKWPPMFTNCVIFFWLIKMTSDRGRWNYDWCAEKSVFYFNWKFSAFYQISESIYKCLAKCWRYPGGHRWQDWDEPSRFCRSRPNQKVRRLKPF